MSDKRKPCLMLPADVVEEMRKEGKRLERSLSWLAQQAWRIARAELRAMPAAGDAPKERS